MQGRRRRGHLSTWQTAACVATGPSPSCGQKLFGVKVRRTSCQPSLTPGGPCPIGGLCCQCSCDIQCGDGVQVYRITACTSTDPVTVAANTWRSRACGASDTLIRFSIEGCHRPRTQNLLSSYVRQTACSLTELIQLLRGETEADPRPNKALVLADAAVPATPLWRSIVTCGVQPPFL